MWEYRGTYEVDVGKGHGILEYDFFDGINDDNFDSLIEHYCEICERFDFFLDAYLMKENNTGLSPNVKRAMQERKANLCITFMDEYRGRSEIKTRQVIVNILRPNGVYDIYWFNFYYYKTENAKSYYDKASEYKRRECYTAAIAYYSQTIRLDPKTAHLYGCRGWMYFCKKNYDEAIKDYTKAIALNPGNASDYVARGMAYSNKNEYELALKDLNQSITLKPDFAYAYIIRGDVYMKNNDKTNANLDYIKALELEPDNEEAKKRLDEIKMMEGL